MQNKPYAIKGEGLDLYQAKNVISQELENMIQDMDEIEFSEFMENAMNGKFPALHGLFKDVDERFDFFGDDGACVSVYAKNETEARVVNNIPDTMYLDA